MVPVNVSVVVHTHGVGDEVTSDSDVGDAVETPPSSAPASASEESVSPKEPSTSVGRDSELFTPASVTELPFVPLSDVEFVEYSPRESSLCGRVTVELDEVERSTEDVSVQTELTDASPFSRLLDDPASTMGDSLLSLERVSPSDVISADTKRFGVQLGATRTSPLSTTP
jgi:hypothetical protein